MNKSCDDPLIQHGRLADHRGLLQVVLLAYDEMGERRESGDRYAAIQFPSSYNEAMGAVEQTLGQYLHGGPGEINSVDILCPMLNIDDEWVWAEFNKKDWNLIIDELLKTRKVLGLRQRKASFQWQTKKDDMADFVRGPLMLTHGKMEGGHFKWTDIPRNINWRNDRAVINRPASYQEAIELIIASAKTVPPRYFDSVYAAINEEHATASNASFKFYSFVTLKDGVPSTDAWTEFPAEAYTNDAVWRSVVPQFNQIFGYTFQCSKQS